MSHVSFSSIHVDSWVMKTEPAMTNDDDDKFWLERDVVCNALVE